MYRYLGPGEQVGSRKGRWMAPLPEKPGWVQMEARGPGKGLPGEPPDWYTGPGLSRPNIALLFAWFAPK